MGERDISGLDLDELVPDPNAVDDTIILDPIAAWPGASTNVVVSATSDGASIIQRGRNNGEPDQVWTRSKPLEGGDWSEWQFIDPNLEAPQEYSP